MHTNLFFEMFVPLQCIPIALHAKYHVQYLLESLVNFKCNQHVLTNEFKFDHWMNRQWFVSIWIDQQQSTFHSNRWPFTSLHFIMLYNFTLFVNWLLLIIWLIDDGTAVYWTPIMGFNNYIQILGYTFVNYTYLHFQPN